MTSLKRINIDAFEDAINFIGEDDGKGNDVGHCPDLWGLHKNGDTTGKFAIHREKAVYNCWVCGGGTLLSLAMAVWDISEDDAIDRLLEFAGEPTDERFEDEIDDLLRDERERSPVVPWFNERVLDKVLVKDKVLSEWLDDRRISQEVATEMKIGFDPFGVKIHKKGRYEGPGVIFPHFWQSRLVGWQTRWIEPDNERPGWVQKYNNTRDMPKRYTIYNYENQYLSQKPLVVVESVPTALFLLSLGYPSIATFGGSITPEQMKLLRACQMGLVLAPDNDKVGMKVIKEAKEYLERFVPLYITEPVGEEDSGDDLADVDDPSEAVERLEDAVDLGLL